MLWVCEYNSYKIDYLKDIFNLNKMESQIFQDSNHEDRDILLIFLMKDFIKNHSLENLSDDIFNTLVKKKFIKSKNMSFEKIEYIKNTLLKNIPTNDFLLKSRFLTDFNVIDRVGKGGFGSVFKVKNKLDNKTYAVKIVNVNSENKELVLREVKNLSNLNHSNIIRYYGCWLENIEFNDTNNYLEYGDDSFSCSSDITDINYTNYLFLQMDFANTNLKEIQSSLTYDEKKQYFRQIVVGLKEIHRKKIIHRDLKPSNILICNGEVKIGDFGLSKDLNDNKKLKITSGEIGEDLTGEMGSSLYSSPEQLRGDKYDYRTDIYSLGVIMYELLNNFSTEMEKSIEISKLKRGEDVELINKYPDELKFIKMLINEDYKKRPSTEKILEII